MKKTKILATLAIAATMALGGTFALTGCDNHEHDYTKWNHDTVHHWKECPDDGAKDDATYGEHVYDESDTTCNDCGYVREVKAPEPAKETGTLSGTVTAYGKPLGGVKVTVGESDTVTSATGKYSLADVEIKDSVTVTFTKSDYADKTLTVAREQWSDKQATLDATMTLVDEKTTVSGVVKTGDTVLEGATVTLGDNAPVVTGADGAYSFEVPSSTASTLTLTVTHPVCETYTEEIEISAGNAAVTKDVNLTAKTIAELGNVSLIELNAMQASEAADYNFKRSPEGSGIDGWTIPNTSHEQANEGLLFHEAGQNIASGSKELKLFAYKRMTFDGTEAIIVRARRFNDPSHNANLQGGGYPEIYVVLVAEDGTVIEPEENPAAVENGESCDDLLFTLNEKISGNYVIAVGTTRGNRVAIESVSFRGEVVTGTITGTIKQNDSAVEGAVVAFGDTEEQTGANGSFSVSVSLRKGASDKITVSYGGATMEIPFTAEDIASGTYALGEKVLKASLPGVSFEEFWALPAVAAENKMPSNRGEMYDYLKNNWRSVGGNKSGGEGFIFTDAGYAEAGTATLRTFVYQKLTFEGVKAIDIKARTFTDQNNVDGHGSVQPELILKLIDSEGREVSLGYNVALVDTNGDDEHFYFTLDEALSGDYVLAIGMARGNVLAVGGIAYLQESDILENTVTGTVKYGSAVKSGETVGYSLGYNVKGETVTNENGEFTLPVLRLKEQAVVINVKYETATESASRVVMCNAADFSDGVCAAGEIALSKTYLPGLTSSDIESMTVLGDNSYNTSQIKEKWGQYGLIAEHGEGTCIELTDANRVSYLYAKITVGDNVFLKFNARRFDRDEQSGLLQLKVIGADGEMNVLAPTLVYRQDRDVRSTNLVDDNKLLIDDRSGPYTEGIYDLSAYKGQTVVIIIQAVNDMDADNSNVHNAINEIAFKSYPFYTQAIVTGTVGDSEGNPVEGAVVSVGGTTVTTDENGGFSLSVLCKDGSFTATVRKDGYKNFTFEVNVNDVRDGAYNKGTIALEASTATVILPGLNSDDIAALSVSTGDTNDQRILFGKNGDTFNGWQAKNTSDDGNNVGINLDGYLYAKVNLGEYTYLKFNDAMKDGVGGKLEVYVVKDNRLVAVPLVKVYGGTTPDPDTRIEAGNTLVNAEREGRNTYEEGVFDFSGCETDADGNLVIVIRTLPAAEGDEAAYNGANELAFFKTANCDK